MGILRLVKINSDNLLLIPIFLIAANLFHACKTNEMIPVFEGSRILKDYPSGSTVCYYDGKFIIMGDDASEVLVLNAELKEIERIEIFPRAKEMRLPKDSKADVESSVLIDYNGKPAVLFFGSGSHSPYRDSAFLLEYETKQVKRIDTKIFFDELRAEVQDLNIEAATRLGNELLMGLRGNMTYPENYIAVSALNDLSFKFKRKIFIDSPFKHAGISGMELDPKADILFITFSSEETSNSYDDGKIGESYLAIISNAQQALQDDELIIDKAITLSELSPEFAGQKIESVSLTNSPRRLLFVADDDLGNTKLFTIRF